MKRDLDMVRDILLIAEEASPGQRIKLSDFKDKYPERLSEVSEHVEMLDKIGFLSASFSRPLNPQGAGFFEIQKIEWSGHDYLDAIRDQKIWKKTKQKISDIGGSAAIDTVKAIALKIASDALGL